MFKNCSRENSLCDACLESFSSLLILLFVDLLTHFSKKFVLPWREIISIHGGRGGMVALYMHIVGCGSRFGGWLGMSAKGCSQVERADQRLSARVARHVATNSYVGWLAWNSVLVVSKSVNKRHTMKKGRRVVVVTMTDGGDWLAS
jgi:hypothetical protein